jgi:hypothetical protein
VNFFYHSHLIRLIDLIHLHIVLLSDSSPLPQIVESLKWTNVVGYKQLKRLDRDERMRQEAIFELILTEQTYIRDLQTLLDVFLYPMRQIVSMNKRIQQICSTIEEIVYYSSLFFSEMETRQLEQDYMMDAIGDILIRHQKEFAPYITYCGQQKQIFLYLQERIDQDRSFADFLRTCQQHVDCKNLDLFSFLLMPMQRITRYPLLLKQILHYTPKMHKDHSAILEALALIEAIAEQSNDAARRSENTIKLKDIKKQVDLLQLGTELDLTEPTRDLGERKFLFEGDIYKLKSGRRLYAFLFNDLFLLTSYRHRTSFSSTPSLILYRKVSEDKECFCFVSTASLLFITHSLALESKFTASCRFLCRRYGYC